MPIYSWKKGHVVEVGPSTDGLETFLSVCECGVWIPPEWARKVATSLVEYADRQDRGELHPVFGGHTPPRTPRR